MQVGDRVYLTDAEGRTDGTIITMSHHAELVIVRWDSGAVERVPHDELTLIEPVRPDGPETAEGGLIGQQPY